MRQKPKIRFLAKQSQAGRQLATGNVIEDWMTAALLLTAWQAIFLGLWHSQSPILLSLIYFH